jgi:hypothetical protein
MRLWLWAARAARDCAPQARVLASSALFALTGAPYSAWTQETTFGGVDTLSLTEVRWLSELPKSLARVLGREKVGKDSIADVREPFNSTGAADSQLPLRRFVIGGSRTSK